jgi:putative tricarboxylic transport membrane protein
VHAQPRFTFGRPELLGGIGFIPAMIGLFGLAEVLRAIAHVPQAGGTDAETLPVIRGPLLSPSVRRILARPLSALRSAGLGVLVGVLPGAGADIASWVAAAVSRAVRGGGRAGHDPSLGDATAAERLDTIADACTANSASLAGAWIPALVLGIPGDSVTAMVIGVLAMKNLRPGPEIFLQQGDLVYGIYVAFILANLVLLPVGLLAIRGAGVVMRVPRPVLLPLIVLLCVVGSLAINGSAFDVGLMLAFGVVGLVCERFAVPVGPMVLGIVLGGPLEERFVQTLTGGRGSLWSFIDRPVAAALAAIWAAAWASVLLRMVLRRFGSGPEASRNDGGPSAQVFNRP